MFDFPFADRGVTAYIRRMGSEDYLVVRDTYLNHNRCQFVITVVTSAMNFRTKSTILEMQSCFWSVHQFKITAKSCKTATLSAHKTGMAGPKNNRKYIYTDKIISFIAPNG